MDFLLVQNTSPEVQTGYDAVVDINISPLINLLTEKEFLRIVEDIKNIITPEELRPDQYVISAPIFPLIRFSLKNLNKQGSTYLMNFKFNPDYFKIPIKGVPVPGGINYSSITLNLN